jgi:GT2 family glycosyltransferase
MTQSRHIVRRGWVSQAARAICNPNLIQFVAPIISVIIPTHNRRDLLPGAIASVLGQSFTDWELVVVDDGSQDDSAAVVEPFLSDPRVRYAAQNQQGRSAARNHGLKMARGEWVAFLDSDDRYLPNGLRDHLNTTANKPGVAMAIGGYEYVDELERHLGERRPWDESGLGLADWLFNCLAMPGCVMIARSWVDKIGGFDPECEIAEDWDLFLRLAASGGPMDWTKSMVCRYRQHAGQSVLSSLTQHHQGAQRALQKVLQQPDLAPAVAALAGRAFGWGHALFARRAFQAGQPEMAAGFLAQAIAQDPQLGGTRKVELIEFLLTPSPARANLRAAPTDLAQTVAQHFPGHLAPSAGEMRQAQARVAVACVWGWSARISQPDAWPAVRWAYWQGVSRDPRWLANRGLWSLVLRAWAARSG